MRVVRALAALVVASLGIFVLYETIEAPATQYFGPTLVHGRGHVVALTFDDGPNARTTPAILALLERNHIRATFFVVGRAVARNPELARRMVRDGDEIGNHTQTHAHLNFCLTQSSIDREIEGAQAAVVAATGQRPRYLRPPFGARDFAAIDAARRHGLRVVMWTAMLGDEAARTTPAALADELLAQVHDGAIIIMHDGDQGRPGRGGRTYESGAVGIVIARLRADGYRFLTVSQMEATQA
jgi:peptidoglycan/xylan/chitin deacetylase (PgdA/CDA1 family)